MLRNYIHHIEVLKIKPCKRNNRQNSDHTKNAANKATLRSEPTQAAE